MEGRIRVERLRRSADIGRLFADGGVGRSRHVLVRALPREAPDAPPRVAVIAPKRLGNAVARNRWKRRLRAAVRRLADDLPPADLAVLARGTGAEPAFDQLIGSVREGIRRAWQAIAP